MSERRKPTSGRANAPALIIANNLDFPIRYAAWFGGKRAAAATELATKADFYVIPVKAPDVETLASRLTEGALENGALRLAQVDDIVAAEINALILARQAAEAEEKAADAATADDQSAGANSPPEQERRALADDWDALRPGMMVLAADLDRQGMPEAWYEAQIVSLEGAEVALRWRDFPREGLLSRTRRHIALLHPAN